MLDWVAMVAETVSMWREETEAVSREMALRDVVRSAEVAAREVDRAAAQNRQISMGMLQEVRTVLRMLERWG